MTSYKCNTRTTGVYDCLNLWLALLQRTTPPHRRCRTSPPHVAGPAHPTPPDHTIPRCRCRRCAVLATPRRRTSPPHVAGPGHPTLQMSQVRSARLRHVYLHDVTLAADGPPPFRGPSGHRHCLAPSDAVCCCLMRWHTFWNRVMPWDAAWSAQYRARRCSDGPSTLHRHMCRMQSGHRVGGGAEVPQRTQ